MANVYFPPSAQSIAAAATAHLWLDKVATAWHRLLTDVSDPYRPERHYMRGPGPKWRARRQSGVGRAG